MSNDIAIKVENLSKIYKLYDNPIDRMKEALHWRGKKYHKDFYALNDVSFEIKKGETVGIIGKNGSGKSTLLKIITGVLTPTSGSVMVNGKISALLELGAGFNPEYTGIENIYFQGNLMGFTREQMDARVDDILAFADIGEFIYQPVKMYSSGMFARLAFAVAINVEPDILIVDEALSVGDAYFQQKCMRFMRKFRDNGGMLLFVSHDTGAVVGLCEKSIWLNHGFVRYDGFAKIGCELYLKDFYNNLHGIVEEKINIEKIIPKEKKAQFVKDVRIPTPDALSSINQIKLFEFKSMDSDSDFGLKGAEIMDVVFLTANSEKLAFIHGGELVTLKIKIITKKELYSPIVGFNIKDKLGQCLFGDNTFLTYVGNPITVKINKEFSAMFEFQMPMLPCGSYSVAVAIAEGTQNDHVQHHWIHDALIFESLNSLVAQGLVGIPMLNICLKS